MDLDLRSRASRWFQNSWEQRERFASLFRQLKWIEARIGRPVSSSSRPMIFLRTRGTFRDIFFTIIVKYPSILAQRANNV